MDSKEFRGLRAGLTSNLPAARGVVLEAAAAKLRTRLENSEMFAEVEVETTDQETNLLVAMVRYRPGTSGRLVASFLEAVWVTELRVEGLDAFTALIESDHVEFQAVTGDNAADCFITLHLVAQAGTDATFEARDERTRPPLAVKSKKHRKRRFRP